MSGDVELRVDDHTLVIVGPGDGAQVIGGTGPQGPPGAITTGLTPPTAAEGQPGDYYLDRNSNVLYGPKGADPIGLLDDMEPAETLDGGMSGARFGTLITFSAPGQITALRYYRSEFETRPTATLTLWDYPSLTEIVSVETLSETAEGWQTATLDPPIDVAAGQSLIVLLDELAAVLEGSGIETKITDVPTEVAGMVWGGLAFIESGEGVTTVAMMTSGYVLVDALYQTAWPVAVATTKVLTVAVPPDFDAGEPGNLYLDSGTSTLYGPRASAPKVSTYWPSSEYADSYMFEEGFTEVVIGNWFRAAASGRITHLRYRKSVNTDPSVTTTNLHLKYPQPFAGVVVQHIPVDISGPGDNGWYEVALPEPLVFHTASVNPEYGETPAMEFFVGVDIPADGYVAAVGLFDTGFPDSAHGEVREALEWLTTSAAQDDVDLIDSFIPDGRVRVDVRYEVAWPLMLKGATDGVEYLPLTGGTVTGDFAVHLGQEGVENVTVLDITRTVDGGQVGLLALDPTGEIGAAIGLQLFGLSGGTPMGDLTLRSSGSVGMMKMDGSSSVAISDVGSLDIIGSPMTLRSDNPVSIWKKDFSGFQRTQIGAPVNPDDATTKAYVDGQVTATAAIPVTGNLLTPNQASIETDLTGLDKLNCTLVRSTAQAAHGTASMLATQTSGTYYVVWALGVDAAFQARKGKTVTFSAMVRNMNAATTTGLFQITTTAGNLAGGTTALPVGVWTLVRWSMVVPTDVRTYNQMQVVLNAAAGGGVAHVDCLGFWEGAGGAGDWAMPGAPIVNQQPAAWDTVATLADLPASGNWLGRKLKVAAGLGSQVMLWSGSAWVVAPESNTGFLTHTLAGTFLATNPAATMKVHRTGNSVFWEYIETAAGGTAAGSNIAILTALTGFRPVQNPPRMGFPSINVNTNQVLLESFYWSSQTALVGAGWTAVRRTANFSFLTADAWPTVAP